MGVQIKKNLLLCFIIVPKAIDDESRTDVSNYAPEVFVFNNRPVNC